MAKQFNVRKPIASVEVGKEKIKEAAQVRDDDWMETLTATITPDTIDEWKTLAINGYQNAGAPSDWLAKYKIGMNLVTHDAFTSGVGVGRDIWKAKMTSDHVVYKWGLQYKGNRYILQATRDQIVAIGHDAPTKYDLRAAFQIVCMQYGRQYLERKLRELFTGQSQSYEDIDANFSSALHTEAGVPDDQVTAVMNAIKQAAFSGAQAIYSEVSGT